MDDHGIAKTSCSYENILLLLLETCGSYKENALQNFTIVGVFLYDIFSANMEQIGKFIQFYKIMANILQNHKCNKLTVMYNVHVHVYIKLYEHEKLCLCLYL